MTKFMKRTSIIVFLLLLLTVSVFVLLSFKRWSQVRADKSYEEMQELARLGNYDDAVKKFMELLTTDKNNPNPNLPSIADLYSGMALAYYNKEQYERAELSFKISIAIRNKIPGPDLSALVEDLNNLAMLYDTTRQYAKAELFYKRALMVIGHNRPDEATSLNGLAVLYFHQLEYAQAIRGKNFGHERSYFETILNKIFGGYCTPRQYGLLVIRKQILETNRSDETKSSKNFAALYFDQWYVQIEPLYKRSLEIYEDVLGPDHPEVAKSLNNLAVLYSARGQYVQAEPLYKRALAIFEEALGPDHPYVAEVLDNMAVSYKKSGNPREAKALEQRAAAIWIIEPQNERQPITDYRSTMRSKYSSYRTVHRETEKSSLKCFF